VSFYAMLAVVPAITAPLMYGLFTASTITRAAFLADRRRHGSDRRSGRACRRRRQADALPSVTLALWSANAAEAIRCISVDTGGSAR
jgi:hypothetical protein